MSFAKIGAAKVVAIVVTYHPESDALCELLRSVQPQVTKVVVVDNHSANLKDIKTVCGKQTEIISLDKNSGLGVAHNQGIAYAKQQNASHVLILDQDSVPNKDMVQIQLQALDALQQNGEQVSAAGATYVGVDSGHQSFFVRFGRLKFQRIYCGLGKNNEGNGIGDMQPVKADFLISSGSLFPVASLNDIGLMDEALFIDHVDTEWFLRARSKGYQAYGVCAAGMRHVLGEKTHTIKLFRTRNVPQHKPFRYYYIFRNSVLLYKRAYVSWRWRWNDIQRLGMIMLMYSVFCPPRWQHFKMMMKGIMHGLFGKTGALDTAKLKP